MKLLYSSFPVWPYLFLSLIELHHVNSFLDNMWCWDSVHHPAVPVSARRNSVRTRNMWSDTRDRKQTRQFLTLDLNLELRYTIISIKTRAFLLSHEWYNFQVSVLFWPSAPTMASCLDLGLMSFLLFSFSNKWPMVKRKKKKKELRKREWEIRKGVWSRGVIVSVLFYWTYTAVITICLFFLISLLGVRVHN